MKPGFAGHAGLWSASKVHSWKVDPGLPRHGGGSKSSANVWPAAAVRIMAALSANLQVILIGIEGMVARQRNFRL